MGCDNVVKVTKDTVKKDLEIPFTNMMWKCHINRQKVLAELIARKATVTLTKNVGGHEKDAGTCTIKAGDEFNLTCGGFLGDSQLDLNNYHSMRITNIDPKVGGGRKRKTRKSRKNRTRPTRRSRY